MDELREYLKDSRAKRNKSVQKAKIILTKIKSDRRSQRKQSKGFPSLTPKKFRKYEQDISRRIQGIFYPNDLNFKADTKRKNSSTKRETCGEIYLNFRSYVGSSHSTSYLHKKPHLNTLKQKMQKNYEKTLNTLQNFSLKPKISPRHQHSNYTLSKF